MAKRRESKWTSVYSGSGDPLNRWYLRFTPIFMDLEAAGFPHGISISGTLYPSKEAAERGADKIDKFFDALEKAILKEQSENVESPESYFSDKAPSECKRDVFSSRMCELGTASCIVQHAEKLPLEKMDHYDLYAELQDMWISEETLDSVAFDAKYGRYSTEELRAEVKKFRDAGGHVCWSCGRPYLLEERANADGHCPNCGVEIELEQP